MKGAFFDTSVRGKPKRKTSVRTECPCGLDRKCKSPRMFPGGRNLARIAVVCEAPGEREDKEDQPLVGPAGKHLAKAFERLGVDLDGDCLKTNVVQCRPPGNRTPTPEEIRACRPRLEKQLKKAKPDLIFALGTPAIQAVLDDAPMSLSATSMSGRVVPCHKRECWVACGFHPSYFLRMEGEYDRFLDDALLAGMEKLGEPLEDRRLNPNAFGLVENIKELEKLIWPMAEGKAPIAFDYETNGLDPFAADAKILTFAFTDRMDYAWCVPVDHPWARWSPSEREAVIGLLTYLLKGNAPKVIQNWQFEELWTRVLLGFGIRNVARDTMVREHVLDNRPGVCSQEFQQYVRYGETDYWGRSVNKANLEREFLDRVARGNALDVRYDLQIYRDQEAEMDDGLRKAYGLFHRTIPLFTTMKQRGMKVDEGKLAEIENDAAEELAALESGSGFWFLDEYRKKYGKKWEPGSNQAKQRLFFDILGLDGLKWTKGGRKSAKARGAEIKDAEPEELSTDAETMEFLLGQTEDGSDEARIIRACMDQAHLVKLRGYTKGVRELTRSDGKLHPSFLLHTVSSYRSSSADPNFQNFPVRVPRLAVLRKAFVPSRDLLMEMDFSGAEVRGYACSTLDKTLISHIWHNVDYHRHYAALLYGKDENEVTSEERYKGKNGFVFPEFYGSGWKGVARANPQWDADRIRRVEKKLWDDLADVKRWQDRTYTEYKRTGEIRYLDGFRIRFGKQGCLEYTQCCNMPNQGFAFHRLLVVLLRLEASMREARMESDLIGQIHDSGVLDCVEDEVPDIIEMAAPIIAEPVWPGIDNVVPWEAEFKVGPNLLEMEKVA